MSSPPSDPLLTVRAAMVLLIAAVMGIGAGVLGFLATVTCRSRYCSPAVRAAARWRCSTACLPAADEHPGAENP